jgi:membrane-bound serine protease (ClpP class)
MPVFQYFISRAKIFSWWFHLMTALLFGALMVGVAHSALAQNDSPGEVVILNVHGVIDPVVAQYVKRGIEAAASSGAELIVIQLDTPGGLDTAMRDIVQTILNSDVPIVVFVAPPGARAASAGVFITVAAHVAAMAPSTNIGAAHPVDLSQSEMPEVMADKVTNDAAAYIKAIAEQRGRNIEWVEQAVRQSESLAATEALERGVIDFVVDDVADLLAKLDGYPVKLKDTEVTLDLAAATVTERPMSWLEVIAHGIVDPNIAYILLSLGTIALIAEFYHPGAIIPGVSGVIALIFAFVALGSLPVNWGGIALIALAFILFILDLQIAGFALSVAGVVSFVLGSLLLFSPFNPPAPTMPRLSVDPWLLTGMTALLVGFFTFALTAALRAQKATVLMGGGTDILIGATGVAVSNLDPQGVVQVQNETWTATVDSESVDAGEEVEVVDTDGLRLRVRRLS